MRRVVASLLLVLPLTSCAGADDKETLTVLAAASLTETFTELAEAFEEQHPGVDVELVFGSSTTLAEQAAQGAPGDVLATADSRAMHVAVAADVVADGPDPFAVNSLVIVTPSGNPAGVERVEDLANPDVEWVRCAPTAPCGALAASLLSTHSVHAEPVSEEPDVKAVVARVVAGEADAGLVYRTDARAAGDDVELVEAGAREATIYEVATLADGPRAADFVALVTSDAGQAVLRDAGFESGLPAGSAD